MDDSAPRLAMVAGEASGDLLAALLLGGLKTRWPALRAFGIGGPRMSAHGFDAWWPHDRLAVRGYVEVLRHYREIAGIRNALGERLLRERPDAFIGVDAPDFNLGLEAKLKAQGIKAIHFVSPSVWAWRGKRVQKMRGAVDHVLCVFPFEPAIYASNGIAATYVGHPLADAIPLEVPRAASRIALALSEDDSVVALLPGSRRSEIEYIAPRLLGAAAEMQRQRPHLRFVLPVVRGLRSLIEPMIARHAAGVNLQLLDGRSHEALAACDVTVVASGTATLEAALYKRPMVVTYVVGWLNAMRMKHLRLQPWVGLPNVLCREFIVPELLQEDATPEALARATIAWLDDEPRREAVRVRFNELHELLRQDTVRLSADAIAQVVKA